MKCKCGRAIDVIYTSDVDGVTFSVSQSEDHEPTDDKETPPTPEPSAPIDTTGKTRTFSEKLAILVECSLTSKRAVIDKYGLSYWQLSSWEKQRGDAGL